MRKSILAFGLVLLAVSAVPTMYPQSTNLAPNPGFELPELAGYHVQAVATLDESNPYEGRYAVRHQAVPGHQWNCIQMAVDKAIPVRAGKLYRLSVASRNDLTNGAAFFGLREVNEADRTIRYQWQPVPLGQATWQRHSLLARPSTQAVALQIYFRITPEATAGSVWWDDVRLEELTDIQKLVVPPPWRLTPLETLVFTRENNATAPARLPVRLEVDRDGHGGTLTLTLQRDVASTQLDPTSVIWSHKDRFATTGPVELFVPTSDLTEGRYRLILSMANADGQTRWDVVKPLAVVRPMSYPSLPPVQRSEISPDGLLLVNGEPFLSVMFYHNPPTVAGLKELREVYGATTAQVWGGDSVDLLCQMVDTAWQAGLYSWPVLFHPAMYDAGQKKWKDGPLTEAVNRLKDHPGVIGWDLYDEPDGQGVPVEEVRRVFELVRRLDPNHVIWVNFCLPEKFAAFAGLSDIASYCHYPLPARGLRPIREHNRAIRAAFPGKPLLSVLQTYGYPETGMPTPAQLRAQVYLNICEGMTMFHFYSWDDPAPHASLATNPELRSYTRLLTHEVHSLRPFLFSVERIEAAISGGAPDQLVWLAKQVGDSVELIVVNPEPEPVPQIRISLPGRKILSAESRFDAPRKLTVRRGALLDALPGYGVGVYRLRTSGGASPRSHRAHAEPPRWEIRVVDGTPTLFVDDQPQRLFYNQCFFSQPEQEPFLTYNREMAEQGGFRVFTVSLSKDRDNWWLGPRRYDWGRVDERIRATLRVAPQAAVILYAELNPPDWWMESHETELVWYEGGLPAGPRHVGLIDSLIAPSYASMVWRRDTAEMLCDLLAHVREADYGERVIGITLVGGQDGQWFHYGDKGSSVPHPFRADNISETFISDYSPRMLEYFRDYLRQTYRTEEALRNAWGDSTVRFDTAQIPPIRERLSAMPGQTVFWDPQTERRLIDYTHCYYHVQSDVILELARAVKAKFGSRFLVGAYAALACSDYTNGMGIRGRSELARLLASPDLDFLVSVGYSQRFLGFPGNFTNLNGSMALHGKLLIEELDHRTFLAKDDRAKVPVHGYVPTLEETIAMFRRDFCGVITRPVSAWYYDMFGGHYHHPELLRMFRQFHEIARKAVATGNCARHEVAVVVDDRSYEYQPLFDLCLNGNVVNFQRTHLGRMGAPYDLFLMSDLQDADLRPYKCIIFLNTFLMTPEDRAMLRSKVCCGGRVVCWTFAPGYLDGRRKSPELITDITGIEVIPNRTGWSTKAVRVGDRITCVPYPYRQAPYDPTPPAYYGTEGFAITDPNVIQRGEFTDGTGCALAEKKMDGWHSVLNCSPYWDAELLQQALRQAEVHIYDDDPTDNIYASGRFVGIHTSTAGCKIIRLPLAADVYDVFAAREIARQVTQFAVTLPARETALFFLGSEVEWRQLT
ncbi:MAG: hypothetical protein RMM51_06355 [Verrucomicrobiae bacterium]|nr:hypothetical protein [Verrucomicrobiae bacterium]